MPSTHLPFIHGGLQVTIISGEREEERRIITVQVIFPTTQRSQRGSYWLKCSGELCICKYLDVPFFKGDVVH